MPAVEKKGKSVEEAIEAALAELQCRRDEATIEILEAPEKGFLGIIGGKWARVRVSTTSVEAEPSAEPAATTDAAAPVTAVPASRPAATVSAVAEEESGAVARALITAILGHMNIDHEIENVTVEEERIRVNFLGQDMGLLIGRKGETLNALQMVTGLIYNRQAVKKRRLILDVEDYRLNREQALESLAQRMADKAKQTRKNIILRPMSAQERRIVHTALQGDTDLTTYSIGEDPNRKVVIAVK
jgi:spoIIIJ-associated protein